MMANISQRERIYISVAMFALLLFIIFQFALEPVLNKQRSLGKALLRKKSQLVEMQAMQKEFALVSQQSDSIKQILKKRAPGFSLFSFLERSATGSKVKQSIAYMKPAEVKDDESLKQTMVEMKLQAVSLEQLVEFLKQIESPENIVGIKRISVQENTRVSGSLDVFLQIVSVDAIAEL